MFTNRRTDGWMDGQTTDRLQSHPYVPQTYWSGTKTNISAWPAMSVFMNATTTNHFCPILEFKGLHKPFDRVFVRHIY